MITPKNLARHELIGLTVSVADSDNPSNVGLMGKVIDETRNSLVIETQKGEKTLLKDRCTFVFVLPSGERVKIDGKILVARPEDRVKKKLDEW